MEKKILLSTISSALLASHVSEKLEVVDEYFDSEESFSTYTMGINDAYHDIGEITVGESYYGGRKKVYGRVIPIRTEPKIGRNQPCPCESGKKYKKCCITT